jgi:hypothetical protein
MYTHTNVWWSDNTSRMKYIITLPPVYYSVTVFFVPAFNGHPGNIFLLYTHENEHLTVHMSTLHSVANIRRPFFNLFQNHFLVSLCSSICSLEIPNGYNWNTYGKTYKGSYWDIFSVEQLTEFNGQVTYMHKITYKFWVLWQIPLKFDTCILGVLPHLSCILFNSLEGPHHLRAWTPFMMYPPSIHPRERSLEWT